jgi:hypothetical protein
MSSRKTLHTSRVNDVDRVLFEWFRQRRGEGVQVSGLLLIQQAKKFHSDLEINKACDYLQGWLHRFKLRHGIRKLSVSGEKLGANSDAAGKFVEDFMKLISDENLTAEQIYNADDTGLFWRCLPRRTLAAGNEDKAFGPHCLAIDIINETYKLACVQ